MPPMPEDDTVRCISEHLEEHIHDFDSPEGPTAITGVDYPPKEKADGTDFETDPHDREAIAQLLPGPLASRRIHSVQKIGNIIEFLLPRDDFDPDAEEEQTVDVLRIVLKNFGEVGWIDEMDMGLYPAAYLPGTEQDRVGRTRVSAIVACKNMRNSDGRHQMILLDSLSHVNWAMLKVRERTVRRDDGGLGSERWFLRAYGQGYDPVKAPLKWAEDMAETFMGRGGRAFTGPEFTGQFAHAENQGRCILFQAWDSEYGFAGQGFRIKSEVGGINWCAQRNVYRGQVRRQVRRRRILEDLVSKLSGITRIQDLQRPENRHLIAVILAVDYQFLMDARFQDESFDVMKADVGKKVAVAANFLIAYEQTHHMKIGRPANNPQDVKFKTYVHQNVLLEEPSEWAAIQSELGLRKLGEPLTKPGLTSGGIGTMVHGWYTNGPKGDQKHYERQSEPGPKQKRVRQPVYDSDGDRIDPSYTLKGGKNQRRLRDIDDGLYGLVESEGTRGEGRKVYKCVMSHLGFSESDFLPGKREDLPPKKKAERTAVEKEAAQATKKAKRWRHRQREKEKRKQGADVQEPTFDPDCSPDCPEEDSMEEVPLCAWPPLASQATTTTADAPAIPSSGHQNEATKATRAEAVPQVEELQPEKAHGTGASERHRLLRSGSLCKGRHREPLGGTSTVEIREESLMLKPDSARTDQTKVMSANAPVHVGPQSLARPPRPPAEKRETGRSTEPLVGERGGLYGRIIPGMHVSELGGPYPEFLRIIAEISNAMLPPLRTGPEQAVPPASTGPEQAVPPPQTRPEQAVPPPPTGPEQAVPLPLIGPEQAVPPPPTGPEQAVPPPSIGPEQAVPPPPTGPEQAVPPPSIGPEQALDIPENMRGHCSTDRFWRSQVQLIELMLDWTGPGVELERDHLRDIARHVIRDTGLLDYHLKHMEGKTYGTESGRYCFRRARNKRRHVVCWLEETLT